MTRSTRAQLDRLRRVVSFGAKHQREFSAVSKAPKLFAEAIDILNYLDEQGKRRPGRAKGAPASEKQAAQADLLTQVERICQTARMLEKENSYFRGKFLLPDKRRTNDLPAAATQFLADAKPVLDTFLDYEMPAGFLDRLQQSIQACQAAADPEAAPTDSRANQMVSAVKRSHTVVDSLTVIMNNKYYGQFEVLAEWVEASAPTQAH